MVEKATDFLGRAIRTWGDERYIPIRQEIDEDWREHALAKPLLKEVLVDFGINSAFFPAEAGGLEVPQEMTIANLIAEELARVDAGFAVACLASIWGLVPIILPPQRNMELCRDFGPKFCGDELCVGCHAMTEPAGGSDIENIAGPSGGRLSPMLWAASL